MDDAPLEAAISAVPAGAWAVGVSGGADSVALLELLRRRADLSLHVAHLDHESRGPLSEADAVFVHDLAARWALPCTIERRSNVERDEPLLPRNRSARFRMARLRFFRQVVEGNGLQGVVLAHHADDQAETVMQRLLRGSGTSGLTGMRRSARVGGMTVLRPLLGTPRARLREVLASRGIPWREDPSNASRAQQRNRVRMLLQSQPALVAPLLELGQACAALTDWARQHAPVLTETFDAAALQDLPPALAREAARRWLTQRAGAKVEIDPAAVERLVTMAADAASPSRQHFPGALLVRRRGGKILIDRG